MPLFWGHRNARDLLTRLLSASNYCLRCLLVLFCTVTFIMITIRGNLNHGWYVLTSASPCDVKNTDHLHFPAAYFICFHTSSQKFLLLPLNSSISHIFFFLYFCHLTLIICLLQYSHFSFWSKLSTQQVAWVLLQPHGCNLHPILVAAIPNLYPKLHMSMSTFTGSSESLRVPLHPHDLSTICSPLDSSSVLLHPGSLPWSLRTCSPRCSSCVHPEHPS